MSREEFLRGLEEALANEVPQAVIRDNVDYYASYISQEMAKGRTMAEIVGEIGEPRIVARTIIDSCEESGAAEENSGYGGYQEMPYGDAKSRPTMSSRTEFHYIDLNKWYWKLLFLVITVLFITLIVNIVGGIVSILFRFAGPILLILLIVHFLKNLKG